MYLARDRRLDRPVALKVLSSKFQDDEVLGRFRREARVTSQLKHPNIVGVFDFGNLTGGSGFIAYEFVDGQDLSEMLKRGVPVTPARVASWGVALGRALQVAHDAGVVHRDLKPANLLIRRDGTPVLCDFGVARVAGGRTVRTQEGVILGTPAYVAPEVWRGGAPGPAADQFALAASLFEALYRARALPGATPAEIWEHLRDGWRARAPARLVGKYPELEAVLLRALSVAPADRFRSMDAFAGAFETADITAAHDHLMTLPTGPITRPSAVMTFERIPAPPGLHTQRIAATGRFRARPPRALVASLGASVLVATALLVGGEGTSPEPLPTAPAVATPARAAAQVAEVFERLPTRGPLAPWEVGRWITAQADRLTDPRFELTLRRLFHALRAWLDELRHGPPETWDRPEVVRELDDHLLGIPGRLLEDQTNLEALTSRVSVGSNAFPDGMYNRVLEVRRAVLPLVAEHRRALHEMFPDGVPSSVALHLLDLDFYSRQDDAEQARALAGRLVASLGATRATPHFPARLLRTLRALQGAVAWESDCALRRRLLPQVLPALVPLPRAGLLPEQSLGLLVLAAQHEVVLTVRCWATQEPGELGRLDRYLTEVEALAAQLTDHAVPASRMLLDPFFGHAESSARPAPVQARIDRIRALATPH